MAVSGLRSPRGPIMADDAQGTPHECESCRTQKKAADEIERLRGLVAELLPFARADAELGASIGQHVSGHACDPQCGDCQWYEDSLLLLERIRAGEFDPMPEALHAEALEAYRNGVIGPARRRPEADEVNDGEA
jgi:hypothetical protein